MVDQTPEERARVVLPTNYLGKEVSDDLRSAIAEVIRAAEAEAYERGCADTQQWPTERERVEQMAGDIHHDAGLIGAELDRVQIANGACVLPGDPSGIHALLINIKRHADAIRARSAEGQL